jgi:hypothetical protein
MFNSKLDIMITAVSPFATEKDDDTQSGLTITGVVDLPESALADLDVGNKKAGLRRLIEGEIPIAEEMVSILFTAKSGLVLKFHNGTHQVSCELADVKVGTLNQKGKLDVQLKLKVPFVTGSFAGCVVDRLKKPTLIELVVTQQDLFAGSASVGKNGKAKAGEAEIDKKKKCRACGDAGVLPSGFCVKCASQRVRSAAGKE